MNHTHQDKENDDSIILGLVLNTSYTIIEFIFGILTGSLALIADAAHNLTDTFTLTVSFLANRIARRDANKIKTFGYGRATILAALLNATVMLVVAVFITIEAIQRLSHPHPIEGGIVAVIAAIGIVVNGSIALVLSKRRNDLNMRSAFIDMSFDALSSLGAMIAGIAITITGINGIDSVVGLLVAGLLVYHTLRILTEVIQILLEGTPKDVNISAVEQTIQDVDNVMSVDDLHVWSIRSGYNALSCHIIIDESNLYISRKIVESVKSKLHDNCNIQHATIEVELQDCTTHTMHEKH